MPIYMDRHDVPGATAADVAQAHQEDLKIQDRFGCRALTYWFDEMRGTAFCLVEAPNERAVHEMHALAHGLIPHQILEVESSVVESFLGRIEDPPMAGAGGGVINESGLRVIMAVSVHPCARSSPRMNAGEGNSQPRMIRRTISDAIDRYHGTIVEDGGRGYTVSFASARNAMECAIEIQRCIGESRAHASMKECEVCIGFSAGIPVAGDAGFFGEAVQTAGRLCDIALPGQVVLSPSMRDLFPMERNGAIDRAGFSVLIPYELEFLHRLMDIVEDKWNDPDIDVTKLGNMIGTSKSQLFRKMVTLTGRSPNTFIREYRLRQAAALLENQTGTISEIAYECGFSSLSYFSKCFKKRYGLLPSEYPVDAD
ncbi:MAG: DUF4242 domain-containing protein [Bacteroidetes bacterium]|nr:DUF4242 domain-containing protein [Bacteroidota bacterium]